MIKTTKRLKKLWYLLFLPLIICGAILYCIQPTKPQNINPFVYWAKSVFFIVVLILVPATSIYMSRTLKKSREQEITLRLTIFEKVCKIRFITFALLAWIASGMICLWADRAFWLIYAVLMVLFFINFPSQGLIEKELQKD